MNIYKHNYCIPIFLVILALMTTLSIAQNDAIRVYGAWARPSDEMSAAYFKITNDGDEDDRLVRVETTIGTAEIHETKMENDVMKMRPIEELEIPNGETVALAPRGSHIMITGLTEPLIEGESLPLTLHFASGEVLEVEAWISHTPIPMELEVDTLTENALFVQDGIYVGQVVTPPILVQDFVAPSNRADLNSFGDTNGTWRVIFFGYMHCPDFCPLTLVDYKRVKQLLGDQAEDVTFMLISVDSVRDTPEAMQNYLDNFDPDFLGFSPDDTTLSRIQPDYGFYYKRQLEDDSQAIYTVDHSTRSYLLDRNGILRASFAYDTSPEMITNALQWYLEYE